MKKRILLVDDEAYVTRMMRRNLEATDRFEVLEVNDPEQALTAANLFLPDLVFLDLMMPGTDGESVAASFANHPQLAHVPIIFLTATIRQESVEPTGSRVGNYTFLAKPIKFDDVLVCINQQLGTAAKTVNRFI